MSRKDFWEIFLPSMKGVASLMEDQLNLARKAGNGGLDVDVRTSEAKMSLKC